ncbi:MAG: MFS transporter [Silvibacterium sp.]|nr:MFS transporter [Silvibacterium sp.]
MPGSHPHSVADPARIMRRVFWRLIPFLFLLYVCAYLDRVNLSFAALSMRRDLGFSDRIYGAGAGLFFISYALFEVPANLVLLRLGPRRWMAIIMVAWGIISSSMALIRTPFGFYLLRFLLGVAEAGFFPGIILCLTRWFPAAHRARAFAFFITAAPAAGIIGAPLSTLLLRLDGLAQVAGWKWLFIGEGAPSIILGIATFFVLTDSPEEAHWLAPPEREWLVSEVAAHHQHAHAAHLGHAFRSPAVWLLAAIYFAMSVAFYALTLWLPIVVKNLTRSGDLSVIALTTVPYLLAAVCMLLVARSSDLTSERKWHLTVSLIVAAVAFIASAALTNPILSLIAIFLSTGFVWGTVAPFWTFPAFLLRGTAAAGGIAFINSVGAVGGFTGPYIMGLASDRFHSFRAALLVTGVLLIIAAMIAAFLKAPPRQARPGR